MRWKDHVQALEDQQQWPQISKKNTAFSTSLPLYSFSLSLPLNVQVVRANYPATIVKWMLVPQRRRWELGPSLDVGPQSGKSEACSNVHHTRRRHNVMKHSSSKWLSSAWWPNKPCQHRTMVLSNHSEQVSCLRGERVLRRLGPADCMQQLLHSNVATPSNGEGHTVGPALQQDEQTHGDPRQPREWGGPRTRIKYQSWQPNGCIESIRIMNHNKTLHCRFAHRSPLRASIEINHNGNWCPISAQVFTNFWMVADFTWKRERSLA